MKSLIMPTENFKNDKNVNDRAEKNIIHTIYCPFTILQIWSPKGKRQLRKAFTILSGFLKVLGRL